MSSRYSPDTLDRATSWRDSALCAETPYNEYDWFPYPGDKPGLSMAKQVCSACPVRQACLEDALEVEGGRTSTDRFGVRGGLSPAGRRKVYERRREIALQTQAEQPQRKTREPAKCGTRSGYQKHLREKTKICPPCRQANTDAYNRLVRTGTTRVAV